ncbi:MAG: PPC domain-containing protein [Myxococcota bacterium]
MTTLRPLTTGALMGLLALTACDTGDVRDATGDLGVDPDAYTKGGGLGKADASVEAIIVDFEMDGQVLASSGFNARGKVEDQLLYTIGHLNGDNSVGRLDQLEVTELKTESVSGGVLISYHAKLPVAWGDRDSVPSSYDFVLPADISFSGQESFTEKYNHDCVDFGAHDVDSGSMWYYYRPERFGCQIDDADVVKLTADLEVSPINTTGKYPEYHKVWEDDVLSVVAVFGKYEDGATSNSDAGISAYNRFSRAIENELTGLDLAMEPANPPFSPGVATPEIVYSAVLPGGKAVEVTAILVDNVRTAGASFDNRYAELTPDADLIIYNGHAGLGANIRALAQKGDWVTGQYAMVFMNGCDTYAYVDDALAKAHMAVNSDDPNGTKYLDIITNAMPSFFREMPAASMALVRGLMAHDDPQTYEQMFLGIDSDEVVLVSGEQDNVYVPGGGGGGGGTDNWSGLSEKGTVTRNEEHRFTTETLAPGRYVFEMDGSDDADLYVRTGIAPTTEQFECRPFKSGSRETCVVELSTDAAIHVMVRGWDSSSEYELIGTLDN